MAILINGDGNATVYAGQDADLIAAICGHKTGIADIGQKFAYELADANTIEVKDGVIITKEGRRIQLDVNEVDLFDIPTGAQGTTNYYIIGYQLTTNETSEQICNTFVQKMDNGTDTIEEKTFRGGAEDVLVSLYRVTQVGLTIDSVDLLLGYTSNIDGINQNLTELSEKVGNGMKCAKYGVIEITDLDSSGVGTVDISDLHLTSSEDYMVILDGNGIGYSSAWVYKGWITSKTATSFSIKYSTKNASLGPISYQVITFK